MSWSLAVRSIPHVFQQIFASLNVPDRLTAAAVCHDWETTIFSAPTLTKDLVLWIIDDEDRELCDVAAVVRKSRRRYRNVAVSLCGPMCEGKWQELVQLLTVLNENCAVEWFWCSAAQEENVPVGLMELGSVFGSLQELELTVAMKSYVDATWPKAFRNLKQLRSLTMHEGHCEALASVQKYCRNLRVLVLNRFGLTKLLGDVLDFPSLERLIVDELFIPKNFAYERRRAQAVLPQLRSITLLTTDEPTPMKFALELATVRLPMTVIFAPRLETVRLSYLLRHFIDLRIEQPIG